MKGGEDSYCPAGNRFFDFFCKKAFCDANSVKSYQPELPDLNLMKVEQPGKKEKSFVRKDQTYSKCLKHSKTFCHLGFC